MTTLIVGCGYLGRRVGKLLADAGEAVFGTARTAARADELPNWGVEPVVADVLRPDSLRVLPEADRVVYCVAFESTAGVAMRDIYVEGLSHVVGSLSQRPRRVVFTSSTGVYGQNQAEWVDENSDTVPLNESGRVMLEAEARLNQLAAEQSFEAVVLRLAGLYGPGRIPRRASLERGEPVPSAPETFLNLVQIDDAARAVAAALERGVAGRTYAIVDDRPVTRREFYGRLAELLALPPPRFAPSEGARLGARRVDSNKRVMNRRMRRELGLAPTYPDIATGLPAALNDPAP